MPTKWENLGITLAELDEYAHRRDLERRREKYKQNPEKAHAQRLRTNKAFLRRCGVVVLDELPPLPWTDKQRRAIMQTVEAMAGGAV